ncbi:kinase-like protein [Meredithblackwellia eburnea MCA 4105]
MNLSSDPSHFLPDHLVPLGKLYGRPIVRVEDPYPDSGEANTQLELAKWEYQPDKVKGTGTTSKVYFARRKGTEGSQPHDMAALKLVHMVYPYEQEKHALEKIHRVTKDFCKPELRKHVCQLRAAACHWQLQKVGEPEVFEGIILVEWIPYKFDDLWPQKDFQGVSFECLMRTMSQLYTVVNRLHLLDGTQHLDIKSENIRLREDKKTIVLIDFGGSISSDGELEYLPIFTAAYTCPEALFGREWGDRLSATDVQSNLLTCPGQDAWGLTCVAYELVTGKMLIRGKPEHTKSWSVVKKELKEELKKNNSPSAKFLLYLIEKRPSTTQVLESTWLESTYEKNCQSDSNNKGPFVVTQRGGGKRSSPKVYNSQPYQHRASEDEESEPESDEEKQRLRPKEDQSRDKRGVWVERSPKDTREGPSRGDETRPKDHGLPRGYKGDLSSPEKKRSSRDKRDRSRDRRDGERSHQEDRKHREDRRERSRSRPRHRQPSTSPKRKSREDSVKGKAPAMTLREKQEADRAEWAAEKAKRLENAKAAEKSRQRREEEHQKQKDEDSQRREERKRKEEKTRRFEEREQREGEARMGL